MLLLIKPLELMIQLPSIIRFLQQGILQEIGLYHSFFNISLISVGMSAANIFFLFRSSLSSCQLGQQKNVWSMVPSSPQYSQVRTLPKLKPIEVNTKISMIGDYMSKVIKLFKLFICPYYMISKIISLVQFSVLSFIIHFSCHLSPFSVHQRMFLLFLFSWLFY